MAGCVDFTLDDFESVSVVVTSFACNLLATRRASEVVGAVLDDAGYVAFYKVARSFFVVDEQERFAFFAEDFNAVDFYSVFFWHVITPYAFQWQRIQVDTSRRMHYNRCMRLLLWLAKLIRGYDFGSGLLRRHRRQNICRSRCIFRR